VLVLAVAGWVHARPSPETGRIPLRWYSPLRYKGSAQNWAVLQRSDGVVHVGNNAGVLEFDGVGWRLTPSPHRATVRSLAGGPSGRVWVGCVGDFGYLAQDRAGRTAYVSLLDQVPEGDRAFSDVWKTHVTAAGVFFQSAERLFRWDGTSLQVWRLEPRLHFSFVVNGELFLRQRGVGLKRLRGGSVELVPGGEAFANQRVYALLEGPDGGLLAAVRESGLWQQRGDRFEQLRTPASELVAEAQVYHGTRLRGGGYALATLAQGVVLLDEQARLVWVFDHAAGLRHDNVKYVYPDRQGGLWMGLERGVARLELASALSTFGEREGLEGTVYDLLRHRGRLYAATARGVYVLEPGHERLRARFVPVPGIRTQVWALVADGPGLLAATNAGLYSIAGPTVTQLDKRPASALLRLPGQDRLLVGLRDGLLLAHSEQVEGERRIETTPVPGAQGWVRSMAMDPDGTVWANVMPTGLLRITLNTDRTNVSSVQRFGPADGLGEGLTIVFGARDGAIFGTAGGLLRFDPERRRFERFAPGGHSIPAWRKDVSALDEDARGNLWLSAGTVGEPDVGVALHTPDGGYRWERQDMQRVPGAYCILAEVDAAGVGAVWFGGARGVTRLERRVRRRGASPFDALVRAVRTLPQEEHLADALTRLAPGRARPTPGAQGGTRLPWELNSLRFEFAAPAFDDERRTLYRTRLAGFDPDWGRFGNQRHRELTNLPPGDYAFEVQAKDIHGQLSRPGRWAFRVAPPWYQTWWARLLLGVGLLGAVGLGVHARTLQLRRRNRELEREVQRRTEQIRQQNKEIRQQAAAIRRTSDENERLLLNILPAPIAKRLREGEQTIVDSFGEVTVLFADVVGFTRLSASMSPAKLVGILNELFSDLDALAVRHGVEKIKTIGDGYMAVAGLPEPRPDHALAAAAMGLDMQRAIRAFNQRRGLTLGMRVGLHTGPVVAGVIGTGKFSYDLWGDTVNTASRMESHGVANRVHVSAATHAALDDAYAAEDRGTIDVKGKGSMHTFLLVSGDEPATPETPVPLQRTETPP